MCGGGGVLCLPAASRGRSAGEVKGWPVLLWRRDRSLVRETRQVTERRGTGWLGSPSHSFGSKRLGREKDEEEVEGGREEEGRNGTEADDSSRVLSRHTGIYRIRGGSPNKHHHTALSPVHFFFILCIG